ncbi:MAG: M48 family metallopeptidase [Nocardioides sp.]
MTDPARRTSLVVTLVGAAAFALVAAWLVPWHPVPGGTPPPVAASSVFSAHQVDRAESFSAWARVWGWSSLAVSLLVACWFGFTRHGAALVRRLPGPWPVRTLLAVAALGLVGRVVTLPLAVAMQLHLRDYGLTHQSWTGFAYDQVVGLLVDVVTTALGIVLLLACARRWRRRWPAVAGLLLAALVAVGSYVYPVLVEPLFNHFTPLPDGPLRTRILRLAAEEHVHVDDVLVADASRRTTTLNAYVSGFGDTRRVVVYDTLVHDLPQAEALSVVAHELGHARHDDVVTGTLLGAAGALVGIGLLGLVGPARGPRRRHGVGDPESVPTVLALLALGTLLASPVQNAVSREIETRADVAALQTTHDPQAFVAMQRQLALHAYADPTPPWLSQLWFGSHPTVLQRIAIADQLGR